MLVISLLLVVDMYIFVLLLDVVYMLLLHVVYVLLKLFLLQGIDAKGWVSIELDAFIEVN